MSGNNHTVFLMEDGTVKTVGYNGHGECGTGNTTSPQLTLYTPDISGVKQVACGNSHTVFLMEDGTVRTVGLSNNGQCCTGNTTNPQLALYTPNINGVKQITCGGYHTVFLMEDGTVRTVGYNAQGQCSTGNTTSPQLTLYTPDISGVKQVACGSAHTVFLMEDGTVRTVGLNNYGQCGTSNTTNPKLALYTPNINGVKQVACGNSHTVFLMEDGTVRTVGDNNYGQCGTGNISSAQLTLYTPNISGVKQITCGNIHTVFLMEDGTVRTVGDNNYGQCGTGNTTSPQLTLYTPNITGVKLLFNCFLIIKFLYLISQNTDIKYYNNGWKIAGLAPATEDMFNNYNFDPSVLTEEQWAELGNTFNFLTWTDGDPVDTYLTIPEFKPIDVCDEVLVWTDSNPAGVDLIVTGNKDYLALTTSQSPKILMYNNDTTVKPSPIITGLYNKPEFNYKVEMDNPDTTENPDSVLIPLTKAVDNVNTSVIVPAGFIHTNPYTIKVTAIQVDGTEITQTGSVLLYNTAPYILGTFLAGLLTGTLGDDENDNIQYQVLINNIKVFPVDTDFTEPQQAPCTLKYTVKNDSILIGQQNTIDINIKDQFEVTGTLHLTFFGEYYGLVFMDQTGNYYSDNLGNIIKYLEMGVVLSGQSTDPQPVNLINKNSFNVNNVNLSKIERTLPENVVVELSKESSPFLPMASLNYEQTLAYEDSLTFYVRVTAKKDAVPGDGEFDINVEGDPVK